MKVFIALVVLLALPVQADVYKSVTADGEVIYSDQPSPGATLMNAPALSTYAPPPLPTFTPAPAKAEKKEIYETFVIDSPVDEATVRDSQGNVEFLVTLKPPLLAKYGHRLEYYVDGNAHGRRTVDTRKVFTGLERGEHQLSVAVVDEDGEKVISAEPVMVYLRRNSIFLPGNPQNPKNKPPPVTAP